MKIGIDYREIVKGKTTGIGRFLLNFLDYADKSGSQHHFYLYGNQYSDFSRCSTQFITRMFPEKNTLIWDQIKLKKAVEKDEIDIFFSPFDKAPIFLKIPTIISIHDFLFIYLDKMGYAKRRLYNKLYLFYRKLAARHSQKIITVSEYSKNDILKIWSIDKDRINVVYNGIHPRFKALNISADDKQVLFQKYNINRPYFLYVGNFKPHKNIDQLLLAFAALPEPVKKSHDLILCGPQSDEVANLKDLCRKNNIDKQVAFYHSTSDEELVKLYNLAKLFIFPSLYEGFGLPPLEAMACGTPVICSNATSLPEVCGDTALLFNPSSQTELKDAILNVINNKELSRQLISKGLERVKQFSIENTSQQLLEVIESLYE